MFLRRHPRHQQVTFAFDANFDAQFISINCLLNSYSGTRFAFVGEEGLRDFCADNLKIKIQKSLKPSLKPKTTGSLSKA